MRLNRHAVCLCVLVWSSSLLAAQAPPDSPPAQASPPAETQPASSPTATATSATSTSPAAPTSTASSSPTIGTSSTTATAPAASQAKTETAVISDAVADKRLRSQGWKRKVVNGELVYCKEEQVLGTRFPKTICGSAQALRDATRQSRDWTEQMEQNIGNPSKRCPLCS